MTIIRLFMVYQELSVLDLRVSRRVSEPCVNMITEICTFKGIAGSVSLVVNKGPNMRFQNRDSSGIGIVNISTA